MDNKSRNREAYRNIANSTLQCLEQGFYRKGKVIDISKLMTFAKSNSVLYRQEEEIQITIIPRDHPTIFIVSQCTTLQTTEKLITTIPLDSEICVLNFASARNPGGGFMKGSNAQEESLARSSGLYPCLIKHQEFYRENGMEKTRKYTDHIIYSPKVPVFRDNSGKFLNLPYCVNFISSPAPNATVGDIKSTELLQTIFMNRALRILSIAYQNKNSHLVLGAWGCGVFGNDPKSIASIFKQLLEGLFLNCFEIVEFAILDPSMAKIFAEVFGVTVNTITNSKNKGKKELN